MIDKVASNLLIDRARLIGIDRRLVMRPYQRLVDFRLVHAPGISDGSGCIVVSSGPAVRKMPVADFEPMERGAEHGLLRRLARRRTSD
jgi:hypothetical protein